MNASGSSEPAPRRRVVLLGSTGSIGESAIKVVRALPERLELVGLAAGTRLERLVEQAREFDVAFLASGDPDLGSAL